MSCLQVLPKRKKSLWKMLRELFFGQKTVSKVVGIHKKAIVKRRSTFERPTSSYVYPVVEKRTPTRQSSSSSEDTVIEPRNILPLEQPEEIINDFAEVPTTRMADINRENHIVTLAQIQIHPNLQNVEQRTEDESGSNVDSFITNEDEQFYDCANTISPQAPHPTSSSQEINSSNTSLQHSGETLRNFDEIVRIDKLNPSRSLNNLAENQGNFRVNSESNENENPRELCSILANNPEPTVCKRQLRSQRSNSMATGFSSSNEKIANKPERRKSYIEVSRIPPITLKYIPSGLNLADRVVWITETGPENGTVRWIGKIREQFYAGVELDKPIGNSSGLFGYGPGLLKRLFICKLPYGRFIPVKELVLHTDYHDNGLKAGIICIICRDDFLEKWEPCMESKDDSDSSKMVATRNCGHLFHAGCLNEWFSRKKFDHQPCPYCQLPMDRNDVIRIFPAEF